VCASFSIAGASASANTISVGPGHSCATRGVEVLCWGFDYISHANSKVPVRVPGAGPAVQVATGFHFTCAVGVTGTIRCWGDGGYGQLGNGGTADSGPPLQVVGIEDAVSVSAGGFHACAVLRSGHVDCWGRNVNGALGNGSSVAFSAVPVEVTGISNAVAVSTADHFDETCALLATGGVDCWGSNGAGQLGNGSTLDSPVPVPVSGIQDAHAIAAGGSHACAVLSAGRLVCWGEGRTRPAAVVIPPVSSVSVALGDTCAVLTNGEARCWGANRRGQTGSGRVGGVASSPRTVQGIHTAVAITTSFAHNCVLLVSGGAACWGYNDYGDLGANLPWGVYPTPQPVAFPPITQMAIEPPAEAPPTAGSPPASGTPPAGGGHQPQGPPVLPPAGPGVPPTGGPPASDPIQAVCGLLGRSRCEVGRGSASGPMIPH
jgi:alpha-tubulin suppressor-like RCC1 family protein